MLLLLLTSRVVVVRIPGFTKGLEIVCLFAPVAAAIRLFSQLTTNPEHHTTPDVADMAAIVKTICNAIKGRAELEKHKYPSIMDTQHRIKWENLCK